MEINILKTKNELIDFEKGLYEAFLRDDPNGWVMNNYKLINGNRLASKTLDYNDIECYAVLNNGKIAIAGSVNYNTSKKLQLEEMGFKINKNNNNFCEGLILYSTKNSDGIDFINASTKLFEFIKNIMISKNIKYVYGTCSRKLKAMYSLLGYDVVDRLIVNGEKKLLMKMEL